MGRGWPGAKSQFGEEDGQVGRLLVEIRVPCVPEWLHARSCSKFMLQKVSLYFLFFLPFLQQPIDSQKTESTDLPAFPAQLLWAWFFSSLRLCPHL